MPSFIRRPTKPPPITGRRLASRPQAAVGYCAVGAAYEDRALLRPRQPITIAKRSNSTRVTCRHTTASATFCATRGSWTRPSTTTAGPYNSILGTFDHTSIWPACSRSKTGWAKPPDQFPRRGAIDPENWPAQEAIRTACCRAGRGREARPVARQEGSKSDPVGTRPGFGYAELCLFLEEEDEYHRACRDLLERFAAVNDLIVAEPRWPRLCLLRPASR